MREEIIHQDNFRTLNLSNKIENNDPVLRNHIVFKKGIYPAVAYLKLVINRLLESEPDLIEKKSFKIIDIFWYHPLILEKDEKKKDILIDFQKKEAYLDYQIIEKKINNNSILSSGKIQNNRDMQRPKAKIINKFPKTSRNQMNKSEIYTLFEQFGITYKGIFRNLEHISFRKNETFGNITGTFKNKSETWLNPGILDAIMQTVLITVFKKRGDKTTFVPYSLGEIVFWETNFSGNLLTYVEIVDLNVEKDYARFNAALTDDKGFILIEIKNLCVKMFPNPQEKISSAEEKSKLAIAASFTSEPISEFLLFWFQKLQMKIDIQFAPYKQIYQELLNPESLLSCNQAGFNLIMFRLEDFSRQKKIEHVEISHEIKQKYLKGKESFLLPNGMEIAHLNQYETQYLYQEIFEEQTYLKHNIQLNEGDVVFDIGANIGMFSLFVSYFNNNVKLYSFEPSPITFDILKTNLELYSPNAVPCNFGISGENTTAEFTFYPKSSVFSSFHANDSDDEEAIRTVIENSIREKNLLKDENGIKEYAQQMMETRLQKKTFTCQLKTLSSFFDEYDIDQVDLLKVDAEKCEWDILMGIDTKDWEKIKQIVIEIHDPIGDLYKKVHSLLEEKGFELDVVEEKLLESSGLFNIYGKRSKTGTKRIKPQFQKEVERNINELLTILKSNSKQATIPYLLCICPASPKLENSQYKSFIHMMEKSINDKLRDFSNIKILNISDFKSIYPFDKYYDEHRDRMGHIPYTQEFFSTIATIVARRLYAFNKKLYKVIVLDCDNTLWKGVCGEVGAEGVEINDSFQYLHKFILKQYDSGVVLCLASKNQEKDVKKVFDERNDMLLKWSHFTGVKINWQSKSVNIKNLAQELNLGLDSFIFIDDNPIECAEVKSNLPEVLTLQFPHEERIKDFLDHLWVLDHWDITDEDRRRGESYKKEYERQEFQKHTINFKDFIKKLNLDIKIKLAEPSHFPRISQLTLRTNQFNFTTIRRKEQELIKLLSLRDYWCYVADVSDRFGDYGLVGVFIIKEKKKDLLVDTFLLSCRVLGRGVEYRMISEIGKIAEKKNKEHVIISYSPTEKNEPAKRYLLEIGTNYKKEKEGKIQFIFPVEYLKKVVFEPSETNIEYKKKNKNTNKIKVTEMVEEQTSLINEIAFQLNRPHSIIEEIKKMNSEKNNVHAPSKPAIIKTSQKMNLSTQNRTDSFEIKSTIREVVITGIANSLQVEISDLNLNKSFREIGIDSMTGIGVIAELNQAFDIVLSITVLYDYPCLKDLVEYIAKQFSEQVKKKISKSPQEIFPLTHDKKKESEHEESSITAKTIETKGLFESSSLLTSNIENKDKSEDIAIIGISGRFPGARDLNEFWEMLIDGREGITEVPSERWSLNEFYDEDPNTPHKSYCKWGGFLEDIDLFDPLFFNISGKEATLMDPQQRLFLEECWKALEDAGYTNHSIADTKCGVFVGAGQSLYQTKIKELGYELDASVFTGNHPAILASRLSYYLNIKGPSMVIDTACSASLVAVHIACESIKSGDSEMALAGGVFINTTPDFYIMASKTQMLSAEGKCKTFDNSADGFVPGEAVGVVVLKALDAAERDNDHIYAVIKGSAVNQDGKTNGIMAPSAISQTQLELAAYKKAKVNPEEITYIETHGTATKLGDPIEVKALTDAFRHYTNKKQFCALGSSKTNIGHAINAAGVTGLIKLVLCLQNKKIPPSLNLKKENEFIDFKSSPFYVNTKFTDWRIEDSKPRLGAVSSFGFSGTNCHMLVSEYTNSNFTQMSQPESQQFIFILSAKNPEKLREYTEKMIGFLIKTSLPLSDIVYTLQVGRYPMNDRLAVVASQKKEIIGKLSKYLQRESKINGLICGNVNSSQELSELLLEGKAGEQFIKNLIDDGDIKRVAKLWVLGAEINWLSLYSSNSTKRVSLPHYPFNKQRYWIEMQNSPTLNKIPQNHPRQNDEKYLPQKQIPPLLSSMMKSYELLIPKNEMKKNFILLSEFQKELHKLEQWARLFLYSVLIKMGGIKKGAKKHSKEDLREKLGIVSSYNRLYEALLDILSREGLIRIEKNENIVFLDKKSLPNVSDIPTEYKISKKNGTSKINPHRILLETCLKSYSKILRGKKSHLEVMFPAGSLDLMEGIYKGNILSDFYNRQLAQLIKSYIELRLKNDSSAIIQILEVGAGTGGTSAFVLNSISEFSNHIVYYYTDISPRFTRHGKQSFENDHPFMKFRKLDIEFSPLQQSFRQNQFDLVFGTNVFHATKKISNALGNVRQLLKPNGILILNEATQILDFYTLTVGLTDGWWLFEDHENRIKGSPLIEPEKWKELLTNAGFKQNGFIFPNLDMEFKPLQHLIMVENSSLLDKTISQNDVEIDNRKSSTLTVNSKKTKKSNSIEIQEDQYIDQIQEIIIDILSRVLQLDASVFDPDLAFQEYGVDSLLAVDIINKINEMFEVIPGKSLRSTDLFNYATIRKLSKHIVVDLKLMMKTKHSTINSNIDFSNNKDEFFIENSDSYKNRDIKNDENDKILLEMLDKLEKGEVQMAEVEDFLEAGYEQ